jgi:hypothetical protein
MAKIIFNKPKQVVKTTGTFKTWLNRAMMAEGQSKN